MDQNLKKLGLAILILIGMPMAAQAGIGAGGGASAGNPPISPDGNQLSGNQNVQLIYNGDGSLYSVTNVVQGDDAKLTFDAISQSYPKLVQKVGKLQLQPEVDLDNVSCGLQLGHPILPGVPAPTPVYQCYWSVTQFR